MDAQAGNAFLLRPNRSLIFFSPIFTDMKMHFSRQLSQDRFQQIGTIVEPRIDLGVKKLIFIRKIIVLLTAICTYH